MKTYKSIELEGFHMQETKDSLTGKIMHTWRHKSGMLIKILPRPGFSKKFAAMTVPYGSINQSFFLEGGRIDVPAGAAHFLEHCVFSRDDDGGLLGRLSAFGASANAYTTHTHTMYYFSSVRNFEQALTAYMSSVLNPYLEQDRIEAERPVILAELNQYMDDPDNRCYMQLLENLYFEHPVRQDIGGTTDSVRILTANDLKLIHSAYYRPGSMSLTLVGDFDEEKIIELVAQFLPKARIPEVEDILPQEPDHTSSEMVNLKMDVASPSFLLGIKDPQISASNLIDGLNLITRQRTIRLVMDTLLSPVSPIYEKLFSEGLINESFGYHYSCEKSFAYAVAGGESPQPEKAVKMLKDLLISTLGKELDKDLFETQKRAAAGDFVRSLDVIEHSGMVQARCNLHGVDLFDYPALYDKMEADTSAQMLKFFSDPNNYCSSIINL